VAGRVTVLTPVNESDVVDLGRKMFRKQLLPKRQIDYKGRKINFDDTYLDNIAQSFRDAAFDTCPLVMADSDNRHTMSPLAANGEIVGVERTPDGVDIIVSANEAAAKVLEENPKVGVSARIVEQFRRSDGKSWPAALQHALITFDPRIPGLRPWSLVDCANETDDVIDLSALTFTGEGAQAAVVTSERPTSAATGEETQKGAASMEPQLTEEELAAIRAVVPLFHKIAGGGDGNAPAPVPAAATVPPATQFTQTELDDVAAPAADEDAAELETVAASNNDEAARALELANARIDALAVRNARLEARENERQFEVEKDRLAREFGVPPVVTDLCRQWLTGEHTVELSNGTQADPGADIRNALQQFGAIAQLLDLSSSKGSPLDSAAQTEADADTAFLKMAHDTGFAQ
jgi:hypothetical protein